MDSQTIIKLCENWVKKYHPDSQHLIRTGYWISQLEPTAKPDLIVAAVTHDIERAFTDNRKPEGTSENGPNVKWDDDVYNDWHGRRSAEFVGNFLKENGVDANFIINVQRLIVSHETGGDYDQNLIKDADSISFLENNVVKFISKIPANLSAVQVRAKLDYMFNRISSEKAKKIAEPFYLSALQTLTSAYP